MDTVPLARFSLAAGLGRLLADPVGAARVVREMATGSLARLPALLTPYMLHPMPEEICIPIIKVIAGSSPAGFHIETTWYRYFSPPPHAANDLSVELSAADVAALKSTHLPAAAGATSTSLWDFLVQHGYVVSKTKMVQDFVIISEERQIEICKVMHGDPRARRS